MSPNRVSIFTNVYARRALSSIRRHCTLLRVVGCLAVLLLADYYLGIVQFFQEVPFSKFSYPLDADYQLIVQNVLKANGSFHLLPSGLRPITPYDWPLVRSTSLCKDVGGQLFLLMLVKSAARDFQNRELVRKSWGNLKNIFPGQKDAVQIRTVFLLAMPDNDDYKQRLYTESEIHKDTVLYDFMDDYWNNTYKAVMGLRFVSLSLPLSLLRQKSIV